MALSQKELAAKIMKEEDGTAISPQYLNDIEHDRRSPTSDHLIRQLAAVLEIDEGVLFLLAGKIPDDLRSQVSDPAEGSRSIRQLPSRHHQLTDLPCMRMIRDPKGRFPSAPHYTNDELDRECERLVAALLRKRHGEVRPRITTDELSPSIELNGASLDSICRPHSPYGDDVEGVTVFHPDREPEVASSRTGWRTIPAARTVCARPWLTSSAMCISIGTCGLEFLHGQLFDRSSTENKAICKRDTIIQAANYDWMEWQAGYVSGAILMPATAIRRLVSDYCRRAWPSWLGSDRTMVEADRRCSDRDLSGLPRRLLRSASKSSDYW